MPNDIFRVTKPKSSEAKRDTVLAWFAVIFCLGAMALAYYFPSLRFW